MLKQLELLLVLISAVSVSYAAAPDAPIRIERPFCFYMSGPLACDSKPGPFFWKSGSNFSELDIQTPLKTDLFVVPDQCKADLYQVLNHLSAYDLAAWQGTRNPAELEYRAIQTILEGLRSSNNPCFNPVAAAYAAGTLAVPYQYTMEELVGDSKTPDKDQVKNFRNLPIYGLDRAVILALALNNAGILQAWPMDPSELGAYECELSKIYFDYRLRPLDLSGVMLHEMDHFLRDKLEAQPSGDSWKIQDIITDEVLASTVGGFHQASIHSRYDFVAIRSIRFHGLLGLGGEPPTFNREGYGIASDLHLYSNKGGMISLWSNRKKHRSLTEDTQYDFYGRYLDYWSGLFLSTDIANQKASLKSLKAVQSAYLTPEVRLPELSLLEFLRNLGTRISFVGQLEYWSVPGGLNKNSTISMNSLNSVEFPKLSPQEFDQWLEKVPGWSQSVSQSCKHFIEALDSGALNGYLPTQKTRETIHSTEGSRPSTEGSRPNGRSVRPCLKPGSDF